jgi:hypothetical protein
MATKKTQQTEEVKSIEDIDISDLNLYNGNPLLKASGQPIRWTKKLVEEYMKCSRDPIYFIEKYVKIITGKGLSPFILYDYQKEIVKSFQNNPATIANCARQSGKCVHNATLVKIRNKKTGEIKEIEIGQLFEENLKSH